MARLIRKLAALFLLCCFTTLRAQLEAGPYIQNTNENKAVVLWYTKTAEPGVLQYGRQMGQWEGVVRVAEGLAHRAEIAGLQPFTKYYYEIGNGAKVHASGEACYFRTHPRRGAKTPFRFMAFGDFGTGDEHQEATAAQMLKDDGQHDFALLLGDLIYNKGQRERYFINYFPIYQDLIRHRPWWPALGNHDVEAENGAAYFEFFETPANNPLQVENYYSFDYANAHFLCLDDELLFEDKGDLQQQLDWAKQDLRAAKQRGQRWLIAMWHKPPYSGGSHTDDEDIQATFVPALETEGVDLVLNGHSHVAERTFLLNNHQIVNQALSQYHKTGFSAATMYVVSGAGGKVDPLKYDSEHKLMAFQLGEVSGYESIYIHGDTLRGSWIRNDGQVMDQFLLIKSGGTTTVELIEASTTPQQFTTHFPNPLHASRPGEELRIVFTIAEPAPVTVVIYDLLGREVAKLSDEARHDAGKYMLRWNGQDRYGIPAASGVYFYRVHAGARVHTAKFLLLP